MLNQVIAENKVQLRVYEEEKKSEIEFDEEDWKLRLMYAFKNNF